MKGKEGPFICLIVVKGVVVIIKRDFDVKMLRKETKKFRGTEMREGLFQL